jgi:pimeloyl-ACP methyl ester carboxylesterase
LDRLVEDVVAMAESIGEPVGLLGYSLGDTLSLGAAARSDVITGVAVYEPAVFEALDEKTGTRFADSTRAMAAAAAEGRLIEAARAVLEPIAHEDEPVALTDARVFQAWARNVPVALQEFQQADDLERPGPTASSSLERVKVPVLYLLGSRASAWHREGARYLSGHLDDFRVIEVNGAGHLGPSFFRSRSRAPC